MCRETSVYLDCARFLAAIIVMFSHFDDNMILGFLPYLDHLGIEAVGVFFVLSGYVIGFVTENRETDLRRYVVNRAARLYSVVLPCLTLTLLLDVIGRHLFAQPYPVIESFRHEAAQIVFSFSFLNDVWLLPQHISPGTNLPFWSLCCEVPFYALFGAGRFLRGRSRAMAVASLLLLCGPFIVLRFPLWLAGLWTYRLCRDTRPSRFIARSILIGSGLSWIGFEALLAYFRICPNIMAAISHGLLLIYGGGLCFALSIIGFRSANLSLAGIGRPASWLAGATFTIYLLHFPLSCFLNHAIDASAIRGWPVGARVAILASATFGLILLTAQLTERRKTIWRGWAERVFDTLERRARP